MNKILKVTKYFKLFILSLKNDPLFIIIYKKSYRKWRQDKLCPDQTAMTRK